MINKRVAVGRNGNGVMVSNHDLIRLANEMNHFCNTLMDCPEYTLFDTADPMLREFVGVPHIESVLCILGSEKKDPIERLKKVWELADNTGKEYLSQGLALIKEHGANKLIITTLGILGAFYANEGVRLYHLFEYKRCREFLLQANKMLEEAVSRCQLNAEEETLRLGVFSYQLGKLRLHERRYADALKLFETGVEILELPEAANVEGPRRARKCRELIVRCREGIMHHAKERTTPSS